MPIAHKWKPIEDLPAGAEAWSDGELDAIREVWKDQREALEAEGRLSDLMKRLSREWAIETGLIERVYDFDRGVTVALIEQGIKSSLITPQRSGHSEDWVARTILDHEEVLEGIFEFVKSDREITTGYIKHLHAALLRGTETYRAVTEDGKEVELPLHKGAYKLRPNSPYRPDGRLHEYCPPEHVASEMERLVEIHRDHISRSNPSEIQAAWLHHAFAQIHPFEDGNGRVARALATVMVKSSLFPFTITADDWPNYIDSLEKPDAGDSETFVRFVKQQQRRLFLKTVEIGSGIIGTKPSPLEAKNPEEALDAIRDALVRSGKVPRKEWQTAHEIGTRLRESAARRFNELSTRYSVPPYLQFSVGTGSLTRSLDVAGVAASTDREAQIVYMQFVNIKMDGPSRSSMVFQLLLPGNRFQGVFLAILETEVEGKRHLASDEPFQTNYRESPDSAAARFAAWLDRSITSGLNLWQRTLA